ncbi:hypothetical protein MtrunA17_Chr2g0299961 [Medicago truncatula]|uniref:Transmembrane protein, putative n=1 Tax=Medicago truncatula TaxID=3880 RepID=G7IGC6_MEDTR|nr:transmembrane protein, putative [Medicago truncatula]RHN73575.1 hypothetical protein MtrunA17_Chr2g0299961 [Medicago truncatula]
MGLRISASRISFCSFFGLFSSDLLNLDLSLIMLESGVVVEDCFVGETEFWLLFACMKHLLAVLMSPCSVATMSFFAWYLSLRWAVDHAAPSSAIPVLDHYEWDLDCFSALSLSKGYEHFDISPRSLLGAVESVEFESNVGLNEQGMS